VVYEHFGLTLSTAMEAFQVFDVDGQKLNDDEVWKRMAVGTVVAVSADAKKVDPTFLKTLAKDTLVVVSPIYAVNAAMMHPGSKEHPVIPSESFSWDSVGIRLQPCDPSALEAVTGATPPLQGAVAVAEVRPNSPASAAGVRVGDLLVALDKWATNDLDELRIVASKPDVAVNGRVKFHTVRNGGIQSGYFDLPTP
jgi:membrane-associated protease RseP (regulator of RpoE activity)